jgi:hypothetical protein
MDNTFLKIIKATATQIKKCTETTKFCCNILSLTSYKFKILNKPVEDKKFVHPWQREALGGEATAMISVIKSLVQQTTVANYPAVPLHQNLFTQNMPCN